MSERQDDPAQWVGRQERSTDIIAAAPVQRMAATLGVAVPQDVLPPLWHWIFHLDAQPPEALGRDGHPKLGSFLPPVPLPRRMWAGGDLTFHGPIPIGAEVERVSTIVSVTPKTGRTGPLCFVRVGHALSVSGRLAVEEYHDIVYRADPEPGAPQTEPPRAPEGAERSETVMATSTLLFRYSALTFNGHRIHYDREYAREVEGYPDLVVHGPLLATLLAGQAVAAAPERRLVQFTYRAISPICGAGPMTIASRAEGDGRALWAASAGGALAMEARAAYR